MSQVAPPRRRPRTGSGVGRRLGGSSRTLIVVFAVLALVAGAGLRVAALADKSGLTHDEAISHLAATCHQGDWARISFGHERPYGTPVAAAEWKRLLEPEERACFGRIAHDLGHQDIHPPLYFWMLHVTGLAVGLEPETGLALNALLSVLTALALWGLARRVLGPGWAPALVMAVWCLSPAAIVVSLEARQYELLALVVVLFAWQALRFGDPPTRSPLRDSILLALLTVAGALTHFYFALTAVACAAFLAVKLHRHHGRLLAAGLGSIGAGYFLFFLLHPEFTHSFTRASSQAPDLSSAGLEDRAVRVVESFATFLVSPSVAPGWLAWAAAAALALAAAWLIARRRSTPGRTFMVALFAWLGLANVALYLGHVSPPSAMNPKHLSPLWPFAAFAVVLAVLGVRRWRAPLAGALVAAVSVFGAITALGFFPPPRATPRLAAADAVLVDNAARGILPPVLARVPDSTPVLAADQRWLIENPGAWSRFLDDGGVLVSDLPASDPRYGNGPARAEELRALIDERHDLVPTPERPPGPGSLYLVR